MRNNFRNSGYTLIEVLVSFFILAMFLGVMYQTFSSGLRGVDRTEDHSFAVLQAESLLAASGVSLSLGEGETSGEFPGGNRWRLIASPIADTGRAREGSPIAYNVTVEVSWGASDGQQKVRLRTIKWGKGQ